MGKNKFWSKIKTIFNNFKKIYINYPIKTINNNNKHNIITNNNNKINKHKNIMNNKIKIRNIINKIQIMIINNNKI